VSNQPAPDPAAIVPAPLAYSPKGACAALACGITHLYELIGARKIEARKSGRKTLITGESLRAYLASLPPADIQTGQRGQA
jgi:excisionase family DNA binding protein